MVGKKYKKIIIVSMFLVIFSVFLFNTFKTEKITKILNSKDYDYLPDKAKEYIKEQYEKSGFVMLTEKNKQENIPYLNPHYVAYLNATEEERKEKFNVVPSAVILDYVSGGDKSTKTYPGRFDLRNVDGVDYTTPNRNQSSSSLCAFFATMGTLESNLLYQTRTPYSSSALKFSERQLDYATSYNGIKNYTGSGVRNLLTEGANFEELARVAKNGLTFVDLNKQPFDLSKTQKEVSDILNFENSEYELNEAINFPYLDTAASTQTEINEYVKMIKDYVMTYGGLYVATGSPQGGCAYQDTSLGNYVIYDTNDTREDDACKLEYHAMEIIGWDDTISYSFCKNYSTKQHSANTSSCSSVDRVTGQGVWILKNSWGNTASYPYLAYNSRNSAISAITDVSRTSDRNWDKIYNDKNPEMIDNGYSLVYTINKDNDLREQLTKIKVEMSWMRYFNLRLYYSPTGNSEDNILIDSRDTADSSVYTINLENQNIEITDGATITLTTDSAGANVFGYYMLHYGEVTAHTKTLDDKHYLKTEEKSASKTNNDQSYSFIVNTETQNINSGQPVKYELYDDQNQKIDDSLISVSSNIVGPNLAVSNININNQIPEGQYNIKSSYKDDYSMSSLSLTSSDTTSNYVYIKYNPNNADGDILYKKYQLNSNTQLPTNLYEIENSSFLQWNTEADGTGTVISNINELNVNKSSVVEVYAIFNKEQYNVIFNSNNSNNEIINQYIDKDTETKLNKNTFKYDNYNFVKWNTKADGTGTSYTDEQIVNNLVNINEDITLYAIWERQVYTVIYNSNNAQNINNTITVQMGDELEIKNNEYTNGEYNFIGWSTDKNGSGTIYREGQTVTNLTGDKQTIILYAVWKMEVISSLEYSIQSRYIKSVGDHTSPGSFKENLNYSDDYVIKVFKDGVEMSDSSYISTGSITKIYQGGEMVDEYVNVVSGDINGNGTITISDVAKVFSHIMNYNQITEDYNLEAADVNSSDSITISDVSKMYSYIMGFIGGLL